MLVRATDQSIPPDALMIRVSIVAKIEPNLSTRASRFAPVIERIVSGTELVIKIEHMYTNRNRNMSGHASRMADFLRDIMM